MPNERVVRATRDIDAGAGVIFELIADPARQPQWDGNDNLHDAAEGQRVRAVGDVFRMHLTRGGWRDNRIVDFEEGRRISWRPCVVGKPEPGHQWGWELEPLGAAKTRVTHIYDWTDLTDRSRYPRAKATGSEQLMASIDRLAAIAEKG